MTFPARLIDGYQAFVATRLPLERSRYHKLAETGQRPEVMVICCCDSRVSPEVIFDAHPGELFVLRNVANLMPPYAPGGMTHGAAAALEFAVQGLKVRHIVVMGHSHCGGIRAYVEHRNCPTLGDAIDTWMSLIAPAAEAVVDAALDNPDQFGRLERASVVTTLANLMTFADVRARVEQGDLQLFGAYFDVATGRLAAYDPNTGAFAAIEDGVAPQ